MSQGQLRWNDLEVTWEDRDVDLYVIVNRPWPGEAYVPERTIVFQMEPWCGQEYQTWGVKTWGAWAVPDESRFLQVRSHRRHLNNAYWQLRATYAELRTMPIRKTRVLSSICGPKYFDPGHIKRVDFLKFLGAKDDDVVRVDVYGPDNVHGFRSYRGQLPADDKDAALIPYRYFFAAENNQERNFITEKLWEPLLTEALCFYWGCPNAAEYVDPCAYIPLDLDDFEAAFQTMKAAILANEWERRLDVIRREKQKVLEHYQFFPTLERVLRRELRLPVHPTDAELVYHKYFADALDERMQMVCFIHSWTRGRDTSILEELLETVERSGLLRVLDRVYVVNVGDEAVVPSRHARHAGKVRLINLSTDANLFEKPTLDLLRGFSGFHPGAKVLYLHTKGASYDGGAARLGDWRRYMLHFLVERFPRCLEALERSDVAGCDLLERPRPHFSGNFWWANARYLSRLPPVPVADRHEAEWWVLGGSPAGVTSLHQSGVDHYREAYPRTAYALPGPAAEARPLPPAAKRGATQATICLVMIVKDEAHVVCEALASVLPHIADYVIVDTGSTDGTPDTIRSFLAARGIQGHLFERPWRDFGWNRTEALSLARQHSVSEYLWMMDADDLVEGRPDLSVLTAHAYNLRFGPDIEYWRLQIFRRELRWRYVGVLHEYPACDSGAPSLGWVGGEYQVQSRRLGSRSRDPRKYERDAAVLEGALDRRSDRWQTFRRHAEDVAGPGFVSRVVRFPAIDGRHITLTPDMAHTFRGNDFGTRRGFVACALSHMALWQELATSDAPGVMILEDDARLCSGFMGQIVELCGRLDTYHPDFDVAFLGQLDWQPRLVDDFAQSRLAVRLRAFDGSRYLGGTFAYILSRSGARHLLALVQRDGIQNGIDRFIHRKAAELALVVAEPHLVSATLVAPGSGLDSDIQNDDEPCRAPTAGAPAYLTLEEPTGVRVWPGQRAGSVGERVDAGQQPERPRDGDQCWVATLTVETYGRRIGIQASSREALDLATDRLPPGWTPAAPSDVERLYSLAGGQSGASWSPIRLAVDGIELFQASTLHRVLDMLESDLRRYVAEMACGRLFVHAGVVGWGGGAVLLPGRSWSGKTTLVAELVRAGATYYSDEYAVLDEGGWTHPYSCRLGIRIAGGRRRRVGIESFGVAAGMEPLPVRLVVLTSYRQAGRWQPRRLSPGQGALSVLSHTIAARRIPAAALSVLCRTLHGATVLESERPDAASIAAAILALCLRTT
jgi:GR25 family glycosyltransferase involved in LPS biosynthesis